MPACFSTETATRGRAWRRVWLPALFLAAQVFAAHAQLSLPAKPAAPAKAAKSEEAAAAPADVRRAAAEQLAEARRQQEAGRRESGAGSDGDELPNSERQRLLDQLVAAYGGRLNLIDEEDALRKSLPRLQEKTAQLVALADTPPYPTIHVDALRDEFDLIRERLKHRIASRQIQENQKQSLIEAQRRAADRATLHQVGRTALPRRFSLPMQEIWLLQPRFGQRQRKRVFRLLAHPRFRAAFDFLELRLVASESHAGDVAFWREAQAHPAAAMAAVDADGHAEGGDAADAGDPSAPKKRRKRRRKPAADAPA